MAVALVMLGTAALAHYAFDEYRDFGDALWNAGLHLLDPSSLHDDEGAAQRTIGVFQVVAGLVLLVGLLFTFVADVMTSSLERLGQADRRVRARDHLLVVGGIDLIPVAARAIAAAAARSGRAERLVVLAPDSARDSRAQLLSALGEAVGELRFELVFGDTAGDSGFDLAAADAARAILLMPSASGPVVAEAADVEVTQSGFALLDYLKEREAKPLVRLLFRRGRNVDASWDLFPAEWDALVGDRTVGATLRVAITKPRALEQVPEGMRGELGRISSVAGLVEQAWEACGRESRPLRLTIVGCGINALALMEDLAEAGAERFELTMIADRRAFDAYLGGSEHPAGVPVRLIEAKATDPERLDADLSGTRPDIVLVTPSPASWDLRTSDAGATLAVLHVLRVVGPSVPVIAELFLPETAKRLPEDPRLLTFAGLEVLSAAVAINIFEPAEGARIERGMAVDADAP